MAKELTRKQEKFVEAYVKTGNGTQAALEVYDIDPEGKNPEKTASVIAVENLGKPSIREALEEALPDKLLREVHREGLMATKPIYNGEGDLIAEDADFGVRHKYLDTAYKLKGSYAPEKSVTITIDATDKERQLGLELLQRQRTT